MVAIFLLAVAFAAGIYLVSVGKPRRRRRIAQRIVLAAGGGVLLTEAYDHSGWVRWTYLGIGLSCLAIVAFEVMWGIRRA